VAFSPNGKILATGDDLSNLARLWNTATGQQIGPALNTGPRGGGISSVAFSRDGKTLATVQNGSVQLRDVATGHQIGKPFASSSFSVAFSPDGKTVAIGDSNSTARLWNVATRHQIGSPLSGGPPGHGRPSWPTLGRGPSWPTSPKIEPNLGVRQRTLTGARPVRSGRWLWVRRPGCFLVRPGRVRGRDGSG